MKQDFFFGVPTGISRIQPTHVCESRVLDSTKNDMKADLHATIRRTICIVHVSAYTIRLAVFNRTRCMSRITNNRALSPRRHCLHGVVDIRALPAVVESFGRRTSATPDHGQLRSVVIYRTRWTLNGFTDCMRRRRFLVGPPGVMSYTAIKKFRLGDLNAESLVSITNIRSIYLLWLREYNVWWNNKKYLYTFTL